MIRFKNDVKKTDNNKDVDDNVSDKEELQDCDVKLLNSLFLVFFLHIRDNI